jgi:hypothetical protein
MDENTHTPGPWLDWDTMEWLRRPKYLLERTEDARLIGAAPELLEALKALHDRYITAIGNEGPEALAARIAIAKAEGRAISSQPTGEQV